MGQEEHQLGLGALENYKSENITRNFFDFQYIIGKGGFGKVSIISFYFFIKGLESML